MTRFKRVAAYAAVAGPLGALVFFLPGVAGADEVDTGFTTAQTTLTGYLTDACALILVIALAAIGILLLRKWAKRAAST